MATTEEQMIKLGQEHYAPRFFSRLQQHGVQLPQDPAQRHVVCGQLLKLAADLRLAGWQAPAEEKTAALGNPFLAKLIDGVERHLQGQQQPVQMKTAAEQAVRNDKALRELMLAINANQQAA